jgi:hypothetical protein
LAAIATQSRKLARPQPATNGALNTINHNIKTGAHLASLAHLRTVREMHTNPANAAQMQRATNGHWMMQPPQGRAGSNNRRTIIFEN